MMRTGYNSHPMSQSMPQLPSTSSSSTSRPLPPVTMVNGSKPQSPQERPSRLLPESLLPARSPQAQLQASQAAAAAARAAAAKDEEWRSSWRHRDRTFDENIDVEEGETSLANRNQMDRSGSKNSSGGVSLPVPGGQRPTYQRNTSKQSTTGGRTSTLARLGSKQRASMSLERIATWVRNSRMMNSSHNLDNRALATGTHPSWGSRWSRISKISVHSKTSAANAQEQSMQQERHAVARSRQPSQHLAMGLPAVTKGFDNLGDFVSYHRQHWENFGKEAEIAEEEDEDSEDQMLVLPAPVPLLALEQPLAWDTEEAAIALHTAANRDDILKVQRLLTAVDPQNRVPPDVYDEVGETAALRAARGGRIATCTALLDARADPMARDTDSRFFNDGIWPDEHNPISGHIGIENSGMPPERCGRTVVFHLRLAGVLDEVFSRIFPMTRVAMMRAVAEALEAFHLKPALVVAAFYGYNDLLGLLLTHTVTNSEKLRDVEDPYMRLTGSSGFSRSESHMTWSLPPANERVEALLTAINRKHWKCAKAIVASGLSRIELNQRRDKHGRTALHLATMCASADLVRVLCEASSSTNVYSKTGRQPLHDAVIMGKLEVAATLLDFRANPREPIRDMGAKGSLMFKQKDLGCTPLQLAQSHGRDKCYQLLLERTLTM